MRTFIRQAVALGIAAVIGACSDSTGPTSRNPAELTIVQLASTAPPLLSTSVTFTACRGSNAEGRLFFDNGSGGEGAEFARLRIGSNSLLRRPEGTTFGQDECVEVTMSVPDPTRLEIALEPTGLVFSNDDPAELRLDYGEAEGITADIEAQLAIWRQEAPGQPYVRLGTVVFDDLDEAEADLFGFSRYALSY